MKKKLLKLETILNKYFFLEEITSIMENHQGFFYANAMGGAGLGNEPLNDGGGGNICQYG